MKKLLIVLCLAVLAVPSIGMADEPVTCPEGQTLESVMTSPGTPEVVTPGYYGAPCFWIFCTWYPPVVTPAVPATYENQCVADPDYEPPVIPETPFSGGICTACMWPNIERIGVYGNTVDFLTQQFGYSGLLVGTSSHDFPRNNKGQPIGDYVYPFGYEYNFTGQYATYHQIQVDLPAGTYFIRPYFVPDQEKYPFYGKSFGAEIQIVIN